MGRFYRIRLGYNASYFSRRLIEKALEGVLIEGEWSASDAQAISLLLTLVTYGKLVDDYLPILAESMEVDPRDVEARDLALYLWSFCREEGLECITRASSLMEAITVRDVLVEGRTIDAEATRVVANELLLSVGSVTESRIPDPNTEYVVTEAMLYFSGFAGRVFDWGELVAATLLLHAGLRDWVDGAVIDLRQVVLPIIVAEGRDVHEAMARALWSQRI